MSIPENAPQWLKDADTKDAVVEITLRFGVERVIWKSGEFRGGEFLGGLMCASSRYYIGFTFEGKICIGCKEKTIAEWDKWFKGKEEFNTKRSDPRFKMIYAHYRAAREFKLTLDKK